MESISAVLKSIFREWIAADMVEVLSITTLYVVQHIKSVFQAEQGSSSTAEIRTQNATALPPLASNVEQPLPKTSSTQELLTEVKRITTH
jgi:hypothetical protein